MLCLSGFELYSRWVPLSRSLNADHNSDPCHAKKKKIVLPFNIPRCSRWHGLRFPIPCLMIPYFDSSEWRRLFLDPLPPFYTSEPLAIVFARAHAQCVTRCEKPGQKPFFIY